MHVAVIGTGKWGKNHVRTLCQLAKEGKVDAVTVCDADGRRAQQIGQEFDVQSRADTGALASDAGVDAVVIATPSATHFDLARLFLKAGKDVLVEKPMTMDPADAAALEQMAKKGDSILMVGHEFRFHPGIVHLKKMVEKGTLGHPLFLSAARYDFSTPRTDMGVLYALAIHDLDLFAYLLGQDYPESVSATVQPAAGIETHAEIACGFADGVSAHATESWMVPVFGKRREFVYVGTNGSVRVDFMAHDRIEYSPSQWIGKGDATRVEKAETRIEAFEAREPLKEELSHFLGCVKNRTPPLADASVGRRSVDMTAACIESARTGAVIRF